MSYDEFAEFERHCCTVMGIPKALMGHVQSCIGLRCTNEKLADPETPASNVRRTERAAGTRTHPL